MSSSPATVFVVTLVAGGVGLHLYRQHQARAAAAVAAAPPPPVPPQPPAPSPREQLEQDLARVGRDAAAGNLPAAAAGLVKVGVTLGGPVVVDFVGDLINPDDDPRHPYEIFLSRFLDGAAGGAELNLAARWCRLMEAAAARERAGEPLTDEQRAALPRWRALMGRLVAHLKAGGAAPDVLREAAARYAATLGPPAPPSTLAPSLAASPTQGLISRFVWK